MKNPLVSIVIPCYNAESYIVDSIESALSQTYENCEIIVIDDGSTDQSLDLIKSFDGEIRWESGSNQGGCVARNRGVELASGKYIQFLDADDLMDAEKIQKQLSTIIDEPDAIAVCPFIPFDTEKPDYSATGEKLPLISSTIPISWLKEKLRTGSCRGTMLHCFLTPRSVVDRAGPWKGGLKINQDGEFFARVFLASSEVRFTSETQVYYRTGNSTSVSRGRSIDHAQAALEVCKIYQKLLLAEEDSEDSRLALRQSYLGYIHEYFPKFPQLTWIAESAIRDLGFPKLGYVGGERFQKLSKIIGLKNALRLRDFLRSRHSG